MRYAIAIDRDVVDAKASRSSEDGRHGNVISYMY